MDLFFEMNFARSVVGAALLNSSMKIDLALTPFPQIWEKGLGDEGDSYLISAMPLVLHYLD